MWQRLVTLLALLSLSACRTPGLRITVEARTPTTQPPNAFGAALIRATKGRSKRTIHGLRSVKVIVHVPF